MEQLPGVELRHHARPVGQQVEAAEGQVGQRFVLRVSSRSLFVGRSNFVRVSGFIKECFFLCMRRKYVKKKTTFVITKYIIYLHV